MSYKVVTISVFDKQLKRLKKKYPSVLSDLVKLVENLRENPIQGSALGKSCYKIRMPISSKGRGKSGGARVITYVKIVGDTVFLLTVYDKANKEDLEPGELNELMALLQE